MPQVQSVAPVPPARPHDIGEPEADREGHLVRMPGLQNLVQGSEGSLTMGDPIKHCQDPINGAVNEIISAQSALNMPPKLVPGTPQEWPDGRPPFLSEADEWAKHAYEHLNAAIDLLRRAGLVQEYVSFAHRCLQEGIDAKYARDALGVLLEKLRGQTPMEAIQLSSYRLVKSKMSRCVCLAELYLLSPREGSPPLPMYSMCQECGRIIKLTPDSKEIVPRD